MRWEPFEGGKSNAEEGSEAGTIVFDEEYGQSARISLERDCKSAPFAITCGVYGWMVHTRFIADEGEAIEQYEAMKEGLSGIVDGLSVDSGREETVHVREVTETIHDFLRRFP